MHRLPIFGPCQWLFRDVTRLLTDEELAAVFGRTFALPAGTVPIVLNVDVPDRALTAALQAAGAALAAIHLPCPGPGDDQGWPRRRGARGARRPKPPRRAEARGPS